MKSLLVTIFIVIASFLLPACETTYKNEKHNIPEHIRSEVIKVELDLDKLVEVKTKHSNAPIKVISFEKGDVLLGVDSDGNEIEFTINDIEEAWVQYRVVDSTRRSNSSSSSYSCAGAPPLPVIGTGIIYFDMFTTTTSYTSGTTSCITSEAADEDAIDIKELEHFMQVNYHNLAKEAASACNEYIDALYVLYIKALYVEGAQPKSLTRDFFCQTLNNNYTALFKDNEYNEFFLPALRDTVDYQLTDDI